uniref:Uncharacterized protein n=1 Tax=viral metagenome TaxID=1070528 RepID=A0A6C0AIE1_9ZZZZ
MSQQKVSIDKALAYDPLSLSPPRNQTIGYKRSRNPVSPPDTTSKPEDIMQVDIPNTAEARKLAYEASAEDRTRRNGGRKRRAAKKARKTRKTRKTKGKGRK